jgi:two-component system, cell cycle sensor histidine kinase and response regulator CckA
MCPRCGSGRFVFLLHLVQVLCLVLAPCLALAADPQPPRCLIINSYHQTYAWTDKQTRGVLDSLTQAGISTQQVAIEYLDAKRFPDLLYDEVFVQLLERKYRLDQIDCVVVTDDPALNFVLSFRARLFAKTPVVFSGVNNYTPGRLVGQSGITGVGETADVAGTLSLAMRLHPLANRLVVVHDQTISALNLRRDADAAWAAMGAPLEVSSLTDLTFEELAVALRNVDKSAIVLLLSFASDRGKNLLPGHDEAEIVRDNCPAPAYGVNEGRLGFGVVGGMLLSGVEHGAIAGRMAAEILAGRDPADIPVDMGNHSRPMFDYQQLRRWDVGEDRLPPGSLVINRPHTIWTDYRELVLATTAAATLLVAIIAALVASIIARRRTAARLAASEAYLEESELRFREVIDYQPIPIAIVHRRGRMMLINTAFTHHFGWTITDIPDIETWWQAAYPDPGYRQRIRERWSDVVTAAERERSPTLPEEVRLACKDGGVRLAEIVARPYDEFIVASFQDITERKAAQDVLKDAAAQWQGTFDAVGDPVWLLDAELRIQRGNRAADALLLRLGSVATPGHLWSSAQHAGCPVELARSSLRREKAEMRIGGRIYEVIADPVLDAQGSFAGCVHLVSDITEIRRFADDLRHTEKLNAIGQLAGGVAHDFNNQLGGILGYADLLLTRLDEPGLRHFATSIRTAALRSADLTRKLLAFARKGQFVKTAVDMHAVIAETAGILSHSIDKRIRIVQDTRAGSANVLGDPSQLQNALLNLGLNARDAMDEGGTLTFSTENAADAAGRQLVLRVIDTGRGMSDEVRAHLFEPFFTTKPADHGTGMGLAAVYGTVHNHGGSVTVDTAPGQGTTFRLVLPLAVDTDQRPDERQLPQPHGPSRPLRILVVDDEANIRLMIGDVLSADGHQVLSAVDGRAALELYRNRQQAIDLVLLDLMMPVTDGRDCFMALRQHDPQVRVVIMSGFSADDRVQTLLAAGACGFLAKPFSLVDLRLRIAETLRS